MIIDDSTNVSSLVSRDGQGYVPRDFVAQPHGSFGFAAPFSMPLIPEEQWPDLIADMHRSKSSILDLCEDAGLPPLNQGWTNICWAAGVVDDIQILDVLNGKTPEPLSMASVAGPVTNFANWQGSPAGVGGWPTKALERIVSHGVNSQKVWAPTDLNPKNLSPATLAEAQRHLCKEWFDGTPGYTNPKRAFAELMTCLLRRIPSASAHNWASHVWTPAKPIYRNGQYGFIARNSGYLRDARGYTEVLGSRAIPDEWVAPRVVFSK